MKMILAIVQADDAAKVTAALIEGGHRVTRVATEGGWLRKENSTLLLGIEDDKIDDVMKILKGTARRRTSYISVPREVPGALNAQVIDVEIGGATVFVLNVERFEYV
ncbi:MAG: cyclic-di-AMP receptor [Chloroflexi bacterium]|nr:cyclic-di-AMP receptor [Chloroflexota bacterium]